MKSSTLLNSLGYLFVFFGFIHSGYTVLKANPSPAKKVLKATLISPSQRPKIDGLLNEDIWQSVVWGDGFVERSPTPGAAPPVQTQLGVLFDGEHLYIAVKMETRPHETPVAWELRRDRTSMWNDDAISIKLDPRLDQRTSLVFVTNPAGAQLDFIALDNGAVFSVEHDAIWNVQTSIQPHAWFAEYQIPISSLLISDQSVQSESIGLNASRDHNARQATDDWSLLAPEFGPFSALHYGRIEGLKGLKSARLLTVTPYGALKTGTSPLGTGLKTKAFTDSGIKGAVQMGGEFKLSLSHSEWLEGTALTDFAQVDLDDPLINLNRFALYFPERRSFFINGLDIFSFGKRGRSQLFFSRKIGLTSTGDEVPITGGLKLYGRRGAVRYGVLSALTDETTTLNEPARLFHVVRGRYDWGRGSSIGVMAVHRSSPFEEKDHIHYGVGADARARLLDTRLELEGFYGLTINDHQTSNSKATQMLQGSTAGLQLSWRDRNFRPTLSFEWVEADFDPVMGFTYRQDYAQASTLLSYALFSPSLSLRTVEIGLESDVKRTANLENDLGNQNSLFALFCLSGNWCFMGSGQFERDEVTTSFERSGLFIQAQRYDSWIGYLSAYSPQGRRVAGQFVYQYQHGYFGGWLHNVETQMNLAISPHFRISSAINYARFEIRGFEDEAQIGNIEQRTSIQDQSIGANLQLIVTPSPTLMIDTVTQINSNTASWMSQARLRWRYLPGSDLFFVLRRADPSPELLKPLGIDQQAQDMIDWRFTIKLSWRFDQPL